MSELAYLPLVPPLGVAVYVACVAGAGALANCSVLAALMKSSRSGLCCIIIQLAAADFLIIATSALPEMWFYNTRSWNFGKSACIAYRGLNVFAATACSYLIATVALHTIATINIELKFADKKHKRNDEEDTEDMGSSHHSLMANSDTSTPPRTMNVDYQFMDRRIRVTPPSAFVWILSASLSIPEFASASTVHLNHNILCTAIDSHHRLNMHSLLAAFNLFLPTMLMIIAAVLLIVKYRSQNLPDLDICGAASALKLSSLLILVYGVFCAPRSIFAVYHVYIRSSSNETETQSFDTEQLSDTAAMIRLALSAANLAACVIRPLLYIIVLPKVRNMFSFGSRNMEKV